MARNIVKKLKRLTYLSFHLKRSSGWQHSVVVQYQNELQRRAVEYRRPWMMRTWNIVTVTTGWGEEGGKYILRGGWDAIRKFGWQIDDSRKVHRGRVVFKNEDSDI